MFFEQSSDRREVCFSTINQQQIRPCILAFQPSFDHFTHHAEIIHSLTFHNVSSVLFLRWPAVAERHACPDPFITKQLSHIEADDVI